LNEIETELVSKAYIAVSLYDQLAISSQRSGRFLQSMYLGQLIVSRSRRGGDT